MFCENIVVIEEEQFDDMNLTDGATFPKGLIKRAKTRVNQKIQFPHDTKQHIRESAINNVWSTQVVQILHEIQD